MGKIKQGILGGFSKKVGTVVGSSWKGIAVMRSLPLSVANPRTANQVANRTSFKTWSQIGSVLLSTIVKPLWDRDAKQMSGYNEFVSVNKKIQDAAGAGYTPEKAVISSGKLGSTAILSANIVSGSLTVTWSTSPVGDYQSSSDLAYIAVLAVQENDIYSGPWAAVGDDTGVARSAGTVTIDISSLGSLSSDSVYVFLAFRRADGSMQGDSAVKLTAE